MHTFQYISVYRIVVQKINKSQQSRPWTIWGMINNTVFHSQILVVLKSIVPHLNLITYYLLVYLLTDKFIVLLSKFIGYKLYTQA